jgi:hypothetical protein
VVQSAAMRSHVATLLLITALAACDGGATHVDGDVDADVAAPAAFVPQPTGVCPPLVNGDVTFAPAGLAPRKVKLAFTEGGAAGPAGPLLARDRERGRRGRLRARGDQGRADRERRRHRGAVLR